MQQRAESIKDFNIELRKFLDNLYSKIQKEIKQMIPEINEWDISYQLPEPKKYVTKDLRIKIESYVQTYT